MPTKKCVFGIVVVVVCVAGFGSIGLLLHQGTPPPTPNETVMGEEKLPYYLDALPQKPDDFDFVVKERGINFCEIEEAYYLQPDFYEESWEVGKSHYTEHDYSRWRVHGYGAYPGYPGVVFVSNRKGEEMETCTLYRTGWGVETWQGIKLVPEKSKYFEVVIDPDEFLLPPSFPDFDEGWVKKLNITVRAKQIPLTGHYEIVVDVVSPSEEKSEKWKSEVLKKNISIERMLEECIKQKEEKELNWDCEKWIRDRRNKYVEGGNINVGERLIIKIIIEGENRLCS